MDDLLEASGISEMDHSFAVSEEGHHFGIGSKVCLKMFDIWEKGPHSDIRSDIGSTWCAEVCLCFVAF